MISVPDSDLDDLRTRLRATRFAKPWPVDAWQAGTDGDELRRLVTHWADGYDWRAHEATVNALPWHTADLDGTTVPYLRFDAAREGSGGGRALPIVLTNGWPSSFYELVALARRLAEHFTVVVPSLPGFTVAPPRSHLGAPTHELWHRLMHDELGFDRYGAHGGDLGAGTTGWLAQAHPEAVVGIHLLDVERTRRDDDRDLTPEELEFLDAVDDWAAREGGYSHEQGTRPLTLAQGLSDSPAGLLAWILEKHRAWSDCGGDLSTRFSDDYLLTQASLYWFTDSISTSFQPYYERTNGLVPRLERVQVPTAVAVFPADIGAPPPRRWIERRYHLTRLTTMPRGGHFAAHEETDLLADDITEFFRDLSLRR